MTTSKCRHRDGWTKLQVTKRRYIYVCHNCGELFHKGKPLESAKTMRSEVDGPRKLERSKRRVKPLLHPSKRVQ